MSAEHHHGRLEIPAYPDPAGRPVDHELLGQFVGAAFEGCASCQEALLMLMVEDPATTARLVQWTCVSTQAAFGGLAEYLIRDGVPGPARPEFRQLARAGVEGDTISMVTACSRGDRRGWLVPMRLISAQRVYREPSGIFSL